MKYCSTDSSRANARPIVILVGCLVICTVSFLSSVVLANEVYGLNVEIMRSQVAASGGEYELVVTANRSDITVASGGEYELAVSVDPAIQIEVVDYEELAIFAERWLGGPESLAADLNGDGRVDLQDLSLMAGRWLDLSPREWYLK